MIKCLIFIVIFLTAFACDFDKPIDIKLPIEARNIAALECYLENNKPYRVLLTRADAYFDTLSNPSLEGATVAIGLEGSPADTLSFSPFYDLETFKIYNYRSFFNVDLQPSQKYNLNVRLPNGEILSGQTTVFPKIHIDTLRWFYRPNDTLAAIRLRFKDPDPLVTNYFRLIINTDSLTNTAERTFEFDDASFPDKMAFINTGYRYMPKRKIYIRLMQIEKRYYEFLESLEAAQNANGNPFAQPARLNSGLEGKGGIGIFTALMPNTQMMTIGKNEPPVEIF